MNESDGGDKRSRETLKRVDDVILSSSSLLKQLEN